MSTPITLINYRPKRPKINSLPQLIYLYEPNIRHVYSPYHYCNVCKVWWLMRNVTAGCYAAKVKQIRALTEQLSPKIFNGHVEGPNLPFLPRHPCGHCRQPTVWLCCCIGWYLTPFCTSTHVLCVQILKANGWMTCHCWLTIAHRYRSAFGAASLLIMSLHGTRVLGQQGRPISVRREATCNLACEELRRSVASGR